MEENKNYYGSLCTELYEILHPQAPQDELEFYLSYARPGQKILEPLCGSGRFLVPFLAQGLDICGMDWSKEMLEKLRQKAPGAKAIQADLLTYTTDQRFDYIFISSGSVSLFTDLDVCRQILRTLKELLTPEGRLVFAVDTVAERCPDDDGYKMSVQVKTGAGEDLVLRTQNRYDERTLSSGPKTGTMSGPRRSFHLESMSSIAVRSWWGVNGWSFRPICTDLERWKGIYVRSAFKTSGPILRLRRNLLWMRRAVCSCWNAPGERMVKRTWKYQGEANLASPWCCF